MSESNELTPQQLNALAAVLDVIIPASSDGRLPGAGEIGFESILADRAELRPMLGDGVAVLDELAFARAAKDFASLAPSHRRATLEASVERAPAFLPTLVAQTIVGYYQNGGVLEKLGLRAGAPFPAGFQVAPTDLSILDPVRERGPFYREP